MFIGQYSTTFKLSLIIPYLEDVFIFKKFVMFLTQLTLSTYLGCRTLQIIPTILRKLENFKIIVSF